MEGQLFSIALTRLDELPLRLVDNHVAGSPLHELIKSVEFSAAMDAVPGLRRRLDAIFRREAKTSGGRLSILRRLLSLSSSCVENS